MKRLVVYGMVLALNVVHPMFHSIEGGSFDVWLTQIDAWLLHIDPYLHPSRR